MKVHITNNIKRNGTETPEGSIEVNGNPVICFDLTKDNKVFNTRPPMTRTPMSLYDLSTTASFFRDRIAYKVRNSEDLTIEDIKNDVRSIIEEMVHIMGVDVEIIEAPVRGIEHN